MSEAEARPGSASVGIEVRRPFAAQVWRKGYAFGTGWDAESLLVDIFPGHAEDAPYPFQGKSCVLDRSHRVPGSGAARIRRICRAVEVCSAFKVGRDFVLKNHDLTSRTDC